MEAQDRTIENSCSFRNIQNMKKPTISGKIMDVLPLIKKSRAQSHTVLIFHCIDGKLEKLSRGKSNSSKKFKIFFFAEAAEKMWSLKLGINDYIAIRKAVPIQDYAYSNSDHFYSKILVVKSLSGCSKRVLFKRNKEKWISFESVLSQKSRKSQYPNSTNAKSSLEGVEEIVSSSNGVNSPTRNEINDSDIDIISSTDWLMAKKSVVSSQAPTNEPDHGISETSNTGQFNENSDKILPPKENNSQKFISPLKRLSKLRSPESLLQGMVRCYQHKNNDENISSRNATSQLKCVYTKLADVRENMVVNIVGIIHTAPDMAKTSNNLCCLIISVIDDSNPDGLKIRIYYNREEDRPVLQTYCLVLCQEMRVSKIKHELCGTISNCRQIVTFDRDDPRICYKHSSDFSLTPEDEERVEWLRNWMFENIPMARPFTPLASIANKNDTVNLRCQIVDIKDFDKNIIVLRVSDGTTCEVPFLRVPFGCDSWQSALSQMKNTREPSKEIDVIVHVRFDHLYKKFKLEFKVGSTVELFNVSLKLLPDSVKTKPGNSLKAYLEGDAQNIKVIRKKDTLLRVNSSHPSKISKTKSKWAINRVTNKRKLFEHSPRNEKDDSDDTDFERSLDIAAKSPKKSRSATETCIPKFVGLMTSSTSSTRAKSSDFHAVQDVLSTDVLPTCSTRSCDREQPIDIFSNTNSSAAVQGSQSTELVQSMRVMDSQLDSISLAQIAREKASSKSVQGHLHQAVKSVVAIERKAIQKKLEDYTTKNDVRNYLVQWPSDPGDEAFYIQVTIMSTIPFINGSSSDFDLLALISGYCQKCDHFFPLYLAKWIVSDDDGPVSICPNCKENDIMSPLKHDLVCELLLNDEFGNSVPGIVMSHHAENFLGCTVSQLCSSVEAKIRVRTFIDSHVFAKGKEKRPLIVKVIRIYSTQHKIHKYHILS